MLAVAKPNLFLFFNLKFYRCNPGPFMGTAAERLIAAVTTGAPIINPRFQGLL